MRTNHGLLFEPLQLLRDHETISAMARAPPLSPAPSLSSYSASRPPRAPHECHASPQTNPQQTQSLETVQKLNDKIVAYPTAGMAYFWRALHRVRHLRVELALSDLRAAAGFVKGANAWQVHYHTALLLEANDDLPGALAAINQAFRWVYVDDVLTAKYRIEQALGGQAAGLQTHRVLMKPTYWGDERQLAEIREGTLAGKLARLERLEAASGAAQQQQHALLALLAAAAAAPCSGKAQPWMANQLKNPSFEAGPDQWYGYGTGFVTGPVQGRPGAESVLSAVMHQPGETEGSGAMQVVQLRQAAPMPVLVKGWSRAQNVSGAPDGGYAIYIDINFADNTHEWGWVRTTAPTFSTREPVSRAAPHLCNPCFVSADRPQRESDRNRCLFPLTTAGRPVGFARAVAPVRHGLARLADEACVHPAAQGHHEPRRLRDVPRPLRQRVVRRRRGGQRQRRRVRLRGGGGVFAGVPEVLRAVPGGPALPHGGRLFAAVNAGGGGGCCGQRAAVAAGGRRQSGSVQRVGGMPPTTTTTRPVVDLPRVDAPFLLRRQAISSVFSSRCPSPLPVVGVGAHHRTATHDTRRRCRQNTVCHTPPTTTAGKSLPQE